MDGLDLKFLRLRAGISQQALAEQLGVLPSSLCRTEQRVSIDRDTLDRYKKAIEELKSE